MSEQQSSNKSGVYGIVIALLLLLSAGLGYFLWQKSKSMIAEKERLEKEMADLSTEKANIARSLDSLTSSYADLRTENESLTSKIATSAQLVQQKEAAINKIKGENTAEINALRAQVEELKKTKSELEGIIAVVKAENAQLKGENARLTEENTQLKTDKDQLSGKVTDLAKQLEEQIRKTQSATFKATSFKVEVLRKDKTTGRARRARDLQVSFDLIDVPQPFQGQQTIYLVITDENGKPITTSNPTKKVINAPAGPVEIIAIQTKQADIGNTQRLSFNHKLEEKLKAGNYVVAIYCDKGLLGASTFRLS
jgi:regulator of replication initiation timing